MGVARAACLLSRGGGAHDTPDGEAAAALLDEA